MESVELQGWLEKISKANSRGLEKTETFNSQRDWLLNCFFLSFSNHENYSIKNICVYSKSKIKTKVTSKQNLEYFKMINRRLFIHKFCNNLKMLLSSSWTKFIKCFRLHQGPAFLRLSTCVFVFTKGQLFFVWVLVFSSSPRARFSSFEYLCFRFHQGPAFLRLSTCVFRFYWFFDSFLFSTEE